MNRKIIFESVIGSHMWTMDDEQSDIDIFRVVVAPTVDIALNSTNLKSKHTEYKLGWQKLDYAEHEIGVVVQQLIKNNLNFILGLFSPLVLFTTDPIRTLKQAARKALSKRMFHSINGMAKHNYRKYIESEKDNTVCRRDKIMRVLNFGITLLKTGVIEMKLSNGATEDDIMLGIVSIQEAYDSSTLQDNADKGELIGWLRDYRTKNVV
jgi:predicted nucleotidyltransferase